MSSPESVQLCGAKKKGGGTCGNRPLTGAKRCRMHGGHAELGHRRGASAAGEVEAGRRVLKMMEDPTLLDERWTVAASRQAIADLGLDDDAVEAHALAFAARRVARGGKEDEEIVVTKADRTLARLDLLTRFNPVLRGHSAILAEAKRMMGIDAILRAEVLPFLGEYHNAVQAILMRATGSLTPEQQAAFRAELDQARLVLLGRVGSELLPDGGRHGASGSQGA